MNIRNLLFAVALVFPIVNCENNEMKVEFRPVEAENRIEVYIDNSFFTALFYPEDSEKPALYPVKTASGKEITRGYPINPRPFERPDHPHHVGIWFNFGDVNGLDFWNNSFRVSPENKHRYGRIEFNEIISENPRKGELVVSSDWVDNDGKRLINEITTFYFKGADNLRTIERVTSLEAISEIVFTGNKEGLLGMRVDRAFEEPLTSPRNLLDSQGNLTDTPGMNNDGVNGVYRNAEGYTGGAVWGKRSPWVALRAEKEGEIITIVLLDNKNNPYYPAWSHARGYGLFAANNLGGIPYDGNSQQVKVTLKPGEVLTFKHKIVIGGDLTDDEINQLANGFN